PNGRFGEDCLWREGFMSENETGMTFSLSHFQPLGVTFSLSIDIIFSLIEVSPITKERFLIL
ncbi:MAG: hypothetical protein VB045_08895, partial [Synergistaceae bacterium]|nr:hypothetical protein [Synergistaceae bacterium]